MIQSYHEEDLQMNRVHHWLCRSAGWKKIVETELLPWVTKQLPPQACVLELGPGYGFATEAIQPCVEHLTCIEIDPRLAANLQHRMCDRNVTVLCEDATSMSISDASVDAVVCLTMLHHVPSAALQDRLFAEVARVLRPGGIFTGTDTLPSLRIRLLHLFDTLVPVDPQEFDKRLQQAGLTDVTIDVPASRSRFRFTARKPRIQTV